MSDPQDIPGRKKPPRAEPIQPDRPVSGPTSDPARDDPKADTVKRQKEQSDAALDNVREGYD